jgi:hypothetical protein
LNVAQPCTDFKSQPVFLTVQIFNKNNVEYLSQFHTATAKKAMSTTIPIYASHKLGVLTQTYLKRSSRPRCTDQGLLLCDRTASEILGHTRVSESTLDARRTKPYEIRGLEAQILTSDRHPAVPFILKINCVIGTVFKSFKRKDLVDTVFKLMLKVVIQSLANFLLLADRLSEFSDEMFHNFFAEYVSPVHLRNISFTIPVYY